MEKIKKRKIVFYGRVSTEQEAQLLALQNQMQWYEDQLQYHKDWKLVGKYIDEGITGTQAKKRPAFMQMIEDAKQGRFDLIVTREVSRFARNTVDALTYVRLLKFDYNVEVFFVEDNIWTMAGDGELRLSLMATLSQDESRKISMRVKAGLEISRKKGAVWGNGNVLGYRKVGDHLEIDEEQAETVRMIYDLYASGQGIKRIAGELELQKRRCSDGQLGVWHPNTIRRILICHN